MTPEQITLVQSSFQRLGPQLPAMATRFYQELFTRDRALRPLFTTPMAEQEVKFAGKLTEIVRVMPRLDELLTHTHPAPSAPGTSPTGYGPPTTRPSATRSSPRSQPSWATASTPPPGRHGPSPTTLSPRPCLKARPRPGPSAADRCAFPRGRRSSQGSYPGKQVPILRPLMAWQPTPASLFLNIAG